MSFGRSVLLTMQILVFSMAVAVWPDAGRCAAIMPSMEIPALPMAGPLVDTTAQGLLPDPPPRPGLPERFAVSPVGVRDGRVGETDALGFYVQPIDLYALPLPNQQSPTVVFLPPGLIPTPVISALFALVLALVLIFAPDQKRIRKRRYG